MNSSQMLLVEELLVAEMKTLAPANPDVHGPFGKCLLNTYYIPARVQVVLKRQAGRLLGCCHPQARMYLLA